MLIEKEEVKIFIEVIYCLGCYENGHFVPTHKLDSVMENKPREIWTNRIKKSGNTV